MITLDKTPSPVRQHRVENNIPAYKGNVRHLQSVLTFSSGRWKKIVVGYQLEPLQCYVM